MTPDQADSAAVKITQSWPNGRIAISVWRDALGNLDVGRARQAYERILASDEHPPSVARYLAEYHRLGASAASAHHREPCVTCDGLGWETIETQRPGHPYPTSGVTPCRCSNGQANREAHRRAVEDNDKQLERHRNPNEAAA